MTLEGTEGIKTTVYMAPSFFLQEIETSIIGQQEQDATRCLECRKNSVAAELSKIQQIVEYLKVLYR